MKSYISHTLKLITTLILSLIIFGCGGGGSSSPVPTTTVSGSVLAGPTSGAVVSVKANGVEVAKSTPSAADGSFTVAIPTDKLTSDLIFEASGGTFDDEAEQTGSGKSVTLVALSAYITGGSLTAGSQVTIDPSSTIIRKMVSGGKSKAAAETDFKTAFGYTPDCSVNPAFVNMSSASTDKQRLSGLRIAAFSQLTKDLGNDPSKQFELIDAMAEDISDGVLDGNKSGVGVKTGSGTAIPEDICNRFTAALVDFQASPLNKTKLTMDKIGNLPFNKTALTDSYKVEYVPGSMTAATGKTMFKIRLTNRSDNSPAIGKTVTLRPYMYMATKSHTTPMEAVVDNGDGTYSCTVYYVMSSVMNGVSMGVWELKVTVNGTESTKFFPVVSMPMGSTALAKLLGVDDAIMGMAGLEKRTWFLFNDGLTGTSGNHTFKLFLATKEIGTMMTFPAVKVNDSLKNEAGVSWLVNTIVVEASTDKTIWVTATDTGNGHWSAPGLTGLSSGTPGKIYVRLTVNGVLKTIDGFTLKADGTNGYQTFTVSPI